MRYIDVQWRHEDGNDPIRLVSELDDDRSEVRKLEFYADGRIGFASQTESSGDTRLGEGAVPSLSEINSDRQFVGVEIEATAFEKLWTKNVRPGT